MGARIGHRSEKRLPADPVSSLREALASGRIHVVKGALRDVTSWSLEAVPTELHPFVEDGSAETLQWILRRHPRLFWHPIVRLQIEYLARVSMLPGEWDRLGWLWEPPYGYPKQIVPVRDALVTALGGFMEGVLGGWRKDEFSPPKKKRVAVFRNRSAPSADSEVIDRKTIAMEYRMLLFQFKEPENLARLPSGISAASPLGDDTLKLAAEVAREALSAVSPSWSGLGLLVPTTERAAGPEWQRYFIAESQTRWDSADVETQIASLFGRRPSAKREKEGIPSLMACAVLAALVEAKPLQILNAVEREKRGKAWGPGPEVDGPYSKYPRT